MKKFAVALVLVFIASNILIGCKKKKDETFSMDGLNGVATENVISVTDTVGQMLNEEVPVIIENADMIQSEVFDGTAVEAVAAVTDKPTPKQIQQALKNAGFYDGKIDGNIGPKTKKAIEAFQSQNSLKSDGKVGAKTWKALSAFLNKVSEVDNPSSEIQVVGE